MQPGFTWLRLRLTAVTGRRVGLAVAVAVPVRSGGTGMAPMYVKVDDNRRVSE
jgi:hypothetical protein